MEIRLKDLAYVLSTSQTIRITYPTGENSISKINDFRNYGDFIVRDIWTRKNELNIELREPFKEETD